MEIKPENKSVIYIEKPKDFEVALEVTVPFLPIPSAYLSFPQC